jgi:predicted acyltransferase
MFMVGVALPYSYAARRARGESYLRTLLHAAVRSFVLVLLGVFLASQHPWMTTNFFFTNVLAQIGLGYLFVFLLVDRWPWLQALVIAAILGGYGYLFYQQPLPEPNFDYAAVGITPQDVLPGTAGHWSKNINFAANFDRKFLNWFPRPEPYEFTEGGYQTLNFIPSIATMILGLMGGELLRGNSSDKRKLQWLLGGGAVCVVLGLVLHFAVGVPIVKRIWTPSWALFSGGGTLWLLAGFYWVIDVRGWQRWSFPLIVVGTNSMLMYLMNQLSREWFAHHWQVHFGQTIFHGDFGPIVQSVAVVTTMWLICFWLYRQRIFLKI